MAAPLSLFTYYRRNVTRVGIVVSILALALFAVTSIAALTGTFRQDSETNGALFNKFYAFSITADSSTAPGLINETRTHLSQQDGIDYTLEGSLLAVKKISLVGSLNAPAVFLKEPDYNRFLDTVGLRADTDVLPRAGTNDIALSEKLVTNRKVSKGDPIGDLVQQPEFLPGKFIVTGGLTATKPDSPAYFALGSLDYLEKAGGRPTYTFFMHPQPGQTTTLYNGLVNWRDQLKSQHPNDKFFLDSPQTYQHNVDENYKFMDVMVWSIMAIITLVMTVSLVLFNVIIFMQRASEFGLLLAIGYSRGYVLRKTLFESLSQIIVAIGLGIAITLLVFHFINAHLFIPNSFQPLQLFTRRSLDFAWPIPVAVALCALLTILSQIMRLDPITILEKRD